MSSMFVNVVRASALLVCLGFLCSGCWVHGGVGHDGRDGHDDHRGEHDGEHREDRH